MEQPKRTLRRKPPPIDSYVDSHPLSSVHPPHLHLSTGAVGYQTPPSGDRALRSDGFHEYQSSYPDNAMSPDSHRLSHSPVAATTVPQFHSPSQGLSPSNYDRSYDTYNSHQSPQDDDHDDEAVNESYIDESFVSIESKPMGPKELPEYDYDTSTMSIPTVSTRQKYRQRLFQHLSRTHSNPDKSLERLVSRSPNEKSPGQLPYPTNDILLDIQLDLESTETLLPQTIPNLQFSLTGSIPIPPRPTSNSTLGSINTQYTNPRHRTTEPEHFYSPKHLPTKASLYPTDTNDSSFNYATEGRSPTLFYDANYEDPFVDEEHDEYLDNLGLASNAESIPTSLNDYDDSATKTPIVSYFDYSVLPELPPSTTDSKLQHDLRKSVLSKSPTKMSSSLTLNTISSIRRRKDDELPPVPLDLPQLPFASLSLVSQHLSLCSSIWSLSSLFEWCKKLNTWLHGLFIPKREFKKALIKLCVFHRRDIPLDVIAQNVDQLLQTLLNLGAIEYHDTNEPGSNEKGILIHEEVQVSGVLIDLTICYGGKHGDDDSKVRCYSFNCNLNRQIDHKLQLENADIHELVLGEDWASHWRLTADDLKNIDPGVSKRQSLLYDLLRFEQTFIQRAKCFVEVVGPNFIEMAKVISTTDIVLVKHFEDDMLIPAKQLLQFHEDLLFSPLLKILISDGKFINSIVEIGELYYNWGRAVQPALLKYMSTVPMIEMLLQNEELKAWIDLKVCNMERVKKLKVNGHILFLSTFNSRYQLLPLQLSDIRKQFDTQEPEYVSLTKAIDCIKKLGLKVNHMKIHADNIYALKRIHKQVVWKHNIHQPNIKLASESRLFIHRGDIERKGDLRINSNTNHLILLDNFLLICEKTKNTKTGMEMYKVIEQPIPIELLIVEEKEVSSSTLNPLSKANTNSSPRPTSYAGDPNEVGTDTFNFPFKIRYAGRGKHGNYTFFTQSERERTEWIDHFITARSTCCARNQKTEPYSIKSISNTCFAYENGHRIQKLQICAPNDPIYDLSVDAAKKLKDFGLTGDIVNFSNSRHQVVSSKVQCMEIFEYRGRQFYLVGLASGIYCFDNTNRWKKVLNGSDITKIAVDVEISLVIVLGNKQLRYHTLDLIINVYYEKRKEISGVSLSKDQVSFFALGRHRELTMLFYAKKKSNSGTTNFKLLIPETDNGGIFSTFKVVKKFYVQAECFGISIFNTSFAVHTNKGFEILELDKLLPRSVPDMSSLDNTKSGQSRKSKSAHPGIEVIRKSIQQTSLKPMGMFKLTNNTEFLLVYSDFAIFTNKHGKLSRYSIIRFQFKASAVSFTNNNLFLVCDEAIEVWSISDFVNGSNKLVQVVVGKGITMINSDGLCFSLVNPKVPGLQLVIRMVAKPAPIAMPHGIK